MPPPEEQKTVAELLAGYAQTLVELRRRGVVRTSNAPAGDYGEWLTAKALGGTLADRSVKSYDVTLPTGKRVQVKARVVSDPPKAGQLQTGAFRSYDFDLAAFVLLRDTDYQVLRAALVPVEVVVKNASHSNHVNADSVRMTSEVLEHEGAIDITVQLREAAKGG
jgi:hypothetical protein